MQLQHSAAAVAPAAPAAASRFVACIPLAVAAVAAAAAAAALDDGVVAAAAAAALDDCVVAAAAAAVAELLPRGAYCCGGTRPRAPPRLALHARARIAHAHRPRHAAWSMTAATQPRPTASAGKAADTKAARQLGQRSSTAPAPGQQERRRRQGFGGH
eukprot:362480-Chlamydomonas_euryale.AAC.7